MAHRSYQHIMRKLESENSHLALDRYASRGLSNNSSLTYQQYLKAIDTLELTTFPIGDIYNNYIQLSI
jgi:Cdc6-like AAA superfamily ATPase